MAFSKHLLHELGVLFFQDLEELIQDLCHTGLFEILDPELDAVLLSIGSLDLI